MVTAVSRNVERLSTLRSLANERSLTLIPCDLADTGAIARLDAVVSDVNVLVHLAGGPPASPDDHATCTKQVIMSINLIGIYGNRIDHAIIGSCTSIYGEIHDTIVADDQSTFPTTYHGASQLASEELWNLFAMSTGKPVTRLRFAPFAAEPGESTGPQVPGEDRKPINNRSELRKPNRAITLAEASQAVVLAVGTGRGGRFNIIPNIKSCSR